jgi:glutathione S-transferase
MKLHMYPGSTTCRPILLLCAEHGIEIEPVVVDLMSGEHHGAAFARLNPGRRVPVLEDGDFVLTESSAILKYLASMHAPETYPEDRRARAVVNSRMDWFNTGFYMDYGYNLIYPQVLPHCRRDDDIVQAGTVRWGAERSREWLSQLDQYLLGPDRAYLCGQDLTIADYMGASFVTLGELIRVDLSAYPNVMRWLATMEALPSWRIVHEALAGWAGSLSDQTFGTLP